MKREHTRSPFAGICLLLLIALPIFYGFSVGPAAWIVFHGGFSEEWLERIYFPLIAVANGCPPFGAALKWYVELWV